MGLLRVGHDRATSLSRMGERNGNPLQCSCLENPRGAWWAAVYGVAQSRTRLKRLSSSSSKTSTNLFFLLYNFMDKWFVLKHTSWQPQNTIFFLIKWKTFTFILKRNSLWLLFAKLLQVTTHALWGHYCVKQSYLYVRTLTPGQHIDNYHFHHCEGRREQVRESSPSYSEWHAI